MGALCITMPSGDFPPSFFLCFLPPRWCRWALAQEREAGNGPPRGWREVVFSPERQAQALSLPDISGEKWWLLRARGWHGEARGVPVDASGGRCPFVMFPPSLPAPPCVQAAEKGSRLSRGCRKAGKPGQPGRAGRAADHNTGHPASPVGWKTRRRRRVKASRRGCRGWRGSQAAECFPAPGSCCDQEEEDVAGPSVSCLISRPLPGSPGRPTFQPRALPREGLAEEENHFSRLAGPGQAFLPHPCPCSGHRKQGWGPAHPEVPTFGALGLQAQGLGVSGGPTKFPECRSLAVPGSTPSNKGSDCKPFMCLSDLMPGVWA